MSNFRKYDPPREPLDVATDVSSPRPDDLLSPLLISGDCDVPSGLFCDDRARDIDHCSMHAPGNSSDEYGSRCRNHGR